MKLVVLFLLFISSKCLSQNFGKSPLLIYPKPIDSRDMVFYNWYEHPKEEGIYVINFELNEKGIQYAFNELNDLLFQII